jgi:hypothetical protein
VNPCCDKRIRVAPALMLVAILVASCGSNGSAELYDHGAFDACISDVAGVTPLAELVDEVPASCKAW